MRVQLPTAKPWILKVAAGNCLHASHLDHLATANSPWQDRAPDLAKVSKKAMNSFVLARPLVASCPVPGGTLPFQNGCFGNKTTKNEEKWDLRPYQSPSRQNQALCQRHKLA